MFGISGIELAIILLFAFLIVGPDKLPDAAKTIGKAIAKFQDAQTQMNDVIKTESENIKAEVADAMNQESKKTTKTVKTTASKYTAAEDAPKASVEDAADSTAKEATEAPARTLSFSERKALYEKERAAKRAAEEEAAKAAAKGDE